MLHVAVFSEMGERGERVYRFGSMGDAKRDNPCFKGMYCLTDERGSREARFSKRETAAGEVIVSAASPSGSTDRLVPKMCGNRWLYVEVDGMAHRLRVDKEYGFLPTALREHLEETDQMRHWPIGRDHLLAEAEWLLGRDAEEGLRLHALKRDQLQRFIEWRREAGYKPEHEDWFWSV